MNHSLVLNKNWSAITVITSFGAIITMCRGRALAMCPETYQLYDLEKWMERSRDRTLPRERVIRTPNQDIEKPEIIILTDYKGVPFTKVNFTKRNIYRRDQRLCQYCMEYCSSEEITIDHIIPKSRGGGNSWTNCVTSCKTCNSKKADRTPKESGMELHRPPGPPKWHPIVSILPAEFPQSWRNFLKI